LCDVAIYLAIYVFNIYMTYAAAKILAAHRTVNYLTVKWDINP